MVVVILVAFLAPFLIGCAVAQTASVTAVCTYAEWTFYKGQSPCQVWGNLQAACTPNVSVGKLDTTTNVDATYPSPSGANATPCQCNVVAYNLMAGCSWCQPNVYSTNWVTEDQWKSGCSSYDASGLPSQASSLSSNIPPWALLVENGSPWEEFDASTIAAAGTTPTATAATGFNTGFGTATGFGTLTGFGSSPTGPFSGGDDSGDDNFDPNTAAKNVGKAVGIAVGIVLGSYLVVYAIVLGVFMTRQKNRKAWYGPTAEFYRNGGRMGDIHASQPLLAGATQASPNPFISPSPSAGSTTTYPTSPYQPSSPQPQPGQYDPNTGYGQGFPAAAYQQPATGLYDSNTGHGQAYPQYHDMNSPQMSVAPTGSTQHIPQV